MKKLICVLLTLIMALAVFASCSAKEEADEIFNEGQNNEEKKNNPSEKQTVRVMTLAGPTGMGMAKLINDSEADQAELHYAVTVATAPDQVSAEVIKGDFDVAAVPVNLASVLYNKTEGAIKVAAVNTLGVLYLLENGNTVNSVSDLKGQKIYATGQGSTPEYTLRYILSKNGIDPDKDVEIEYIAEHSELATKIISGDVKLGMLPEPNVTSVGLNNSDVRIALDLTEEWNKVAESELVQGCIIVSSKFAEENPDALETFLKEYKASVEFVNANADEAAAMIESAGIIPKAAVAKKALPNCNIVFVDGENMKKAVSGMLGILYEFNNKSVGGKLPDDAFYYLGK